MNPQQAFTHEATQNNNVKSTCVYPTVEHVDLLTAHDYPLSAWQFETFYAHTCAQRTQLDSCAHAHYMFIDHSHSVPSLCLSVLPVVLLRSLPDTLVSSFVCALSDQ